MDDRPVTAGAGSEATPVPPPKPRPNWKLDKSIAEHTQGIVASGFSQFPSGCALFLRFKTAEEGGAETVGGAWLKELKKEVQVSSGAPDGSETVAAALAFTWTGLQRMGLDPRALASFSRPFREGMFQEDRLRRLGDRRLGAWLNTVVDGGPRWSGNVPLRDPTLPDPARVSATSVPHPGDREEDVRTPLTVHALLLIYTAVGEAESWSARVRSRLGEVGVEVVREVGLFLDSKKEMAEQGFSREHFGFADALSQPIPYGLPVPADESKLVSIDGAKAEKDPVQGVPLGEILMGYQNGHSEPAPGPLVDHQHREGSLKGELDSRIDAAGLPAHPLAEGFADLGINGSYLVVRELKQDVAAFWHSFDRNAARLKEAEPTVGDIDAQWLAERAVGRSMNGHMLTPGEYHPPHKARYLPLDRYGEPDSDFLFRLPDPKGIGCPAGSHVRRAFPRDALAPLPTEDSRQTLLGAANNHRILRRGRKYGRRIEDPRTDDGVDRGLLFMCLNTDITRQFEFVQQTWLLNTTFATLYGEADPLVGPPGAFTIPGEPLRRTAQVETYVQFNGGEYFFLPSMPALRYLELL